MTNSSKTIVFFGSGPVAAASLDFLSKYFLVEAVITKRVPLHHKGLAPVEELAKKLQIKTLFADNKTEIDQILSENQFASPIGIVVDYGVIISKTAIDYFPLGIINSHFSLLPEWRGADPITFSILSGQEKTGVSLMVIDTALDTGKLITRKSLLINHNETTETLTTKLVDLSNQLLLEYLPKYINGQIKPKNQPHPDRATYSRKILKKDSLIDWSKSATQIEREIRAYLGWPKSRTNLLRKDVIITKAHPINKPVTQLDIRCGDNKYLSIDELLAPSGKTMSAKSFLNGYKN